MDHRAVQETVPLLSTHPRRRSSTGNAELDELETLRPLDPELNEVLEKILTPKSTLESLALPHAAELEGGFLEDVDRFDEDDFNGA